MILNSTIDRFLWDFIQHTAWHNEADQQLLWVLMGDFNLILESKDKLSQNIDLTGAHQFQEAMSQSALLDFRSEGLW